MVAGGRVPLTIAIPARRTGRSRPPGTFPLLGGKLARGGKGNARPLSAPPRPDDRHPHRDAGTSGPPLIPSPPCAIACHEHRRSTRNSARPPNLQAKAGRWSLEYERTEGAQADMPGWGGKRRHRNPDPPEVRQQGGGIGLCQSKGLDRAPDPAAPTLETAGLRDNFGKLRDVLGKGQPRANASTTAIRRSLKILQVDGAS